MDGEKINKNLGSSEYVAIKALEDGVTVIGVTRGTENKFLHTEKLDAGEVWLAQFTENISAMKIRGNAKIYTKLGEISSGK
jgi:transcription attenuation protein (tryptophan RNA-binding attenuator protein)